MLKFPIGCASDACGRNDRKASAKSAIASRFICRTTEEDAKADGEKLSKKPSPTGRGLGEGRSHGVNSTLTRRFAPASPSGRGTYSTNVFAVPLGVVTLTANGGRSSCGS